MEVGLIFRCETRRPARETPLWWRRAVKTSPRALISQRVNICGRTCQQGARELLQLEGFILLNGSAVQASIPTTLEGPFEPVTRRFDPSLRSGSNDLPMDHPRLKKNVASNFSEQIALEISSRDAQIGKNVTPLVPSTIGSEVWYGKTSGKHITKVINQEQSTITNAGIAQSPL